MVNENVISRCPVCNKDFQQARYYTKTLCSKKCLYAKGRRKKDFSGEVFKNWRVLQHAGLHGLNSYRRGNNQRQVNFWLVECTNCKTVCEKDINNMQRSKGCRECGLLPRGRIGLGKLYRTYKAGATVRGLGFQLTVEEFESLTRLRCFYCGKLPDLISSCGAEWGSYLYNGIDRKDSDVGYILSNCLPCCHICNRGKLTMPFEDYCAHVRQMYRNFSANDVPLLRSGLAEELPSEIDEVLADTTPRNTEGIID